MLKLRRKKGHKKKSRINSKKKYGIGLRRSKQVRPNLNLLYLIILFLIGGLLMIYSASALIAYIKHNDTFFFFKRQVIWIVAGFFLGAVFYYLPISSIKRLNKPMLLIGFLMLLYLLPEALSPLKEGSDVKVIEFPFVKTLNGATRWIDLGFFDLQPSEFIKLPLIIFTAEWLSSERKVPEWIEDFYRNSQNFLYFVFITLYVFLPFIVIGFASILIIPEDLDTVIIIGITFLVTSYVGGSKKEHNLITAISAFISLCVGSVAILIEGYRKERVAAWIDILLKGEPAADAKLKGSFQVWNALIAIGSGGIASKSLLFGLGYGESRQKLFFLQEAAYTDSIFAIIAEEFGITGALFIIVGFLYLASIGINIAKETKDKFSSNLAIGLTIWMVVQAFLNIAANLAVIPFGGMPLPFFTYGGSNTIMLMIAIGILLNISKQPKITAASRVNLKKAL